MDTVARDTPRTVTSRCKVKYRASAWRVSEWCVQSCTGGATVCRCAALVTGAGAALVWTGAGDAPPRLEELALGVPGPRAAATTLLGGEPLEPAAALARRLAAALHQPVHVCGGAPLDRAARPLVERALLLHLTRRDRESPPSPPEDHLD